VGRLLLVLVLSTGGCAIDRAGHGRAGFDAGPGRRSDAGREPAPDGGGAARMDASIRDAGRDAGRLPDAGRPDAGSRDAGCGPSRTGCSTAGDSIEVCSRGELRVTPCARGCTEERCRSETFCRYDPGPPTLMPGVNPVDTCGEGDDQRFRDAPPSCVAAYPATGDDVVKRFDVSRRRTVRLELINVDMPYRNLDPMLYLRRDDCDSDGVQLACNDDRAMGVRDSLIEMVLDPGDYFVVVDSYYDGSNAYCGRMELHLTFVD
jgi:hypothetical protein